MTEVNATPAFVSADCHAALVGSVLPEPISNTFSESCGGVAADEATDATPKIPAGTANRTGIAIRNRREDPKNVRITNKSSQIDRSPEGAVGTTSWFQHIASNNSVR